MQILLQAPHESLPDAFAEFVDQSVRDVLAHHAERLTRVEVHLRDQNAHKGGIDKRCVIEARPRGLDPLTAEHDGEDVKGAFRGALDKLERVLANRFGKLAARDRGEG